MKITKAMELVALSKLIKSKQKAEEVSPFFDRIYNIMIDISFGMQRADSILLKQRPVEKRCYIIIAGDKGFAGGYNSNLFRFFQDNVKDKNNITIMPIGVKTVDFLKKREYEIYKEYSNISEHLTLEQAMDISKEVVNGFINNHFQEIYLIYTEFISLLTQKPQIIKVLPLLFDNKNKIKRTNNIIYDPSPEKVFEVITPQYIAGILYGANFKAYASEQAARRMAMEAANKNSEEMLHDINIILNRTRQSEITQEIAEISAGANI